MKIIKQRQTVTVVQYSVEFRQEGRDGGWAWDCDQDGSNVILRNPEASKNYAKCLAGQDGIYCIGIRKDEWSYTEPSVGKCVCGSHVELDRFTNTCDRCDRDYNMSGCELAPRSQWGEETGEAWYDVVQGGSDDY